MSSSGKAEDFVSREMLTLIARILCKHDSRLCELNEDDNWQMYSENFKDLAIEYLRSMPVALISKANTHFGG